ncbi:phage neck terminator protein [Burkholderia plantarii]|uniref:phage neck terminator protein n=1 Tax=Burkholderia plantarii TaxID=41899 RepID=UPI0008708DA2|nr:hypothetical protein [Burkholderia plantarii]
MNDSSTGGYLTPASAQPPIEDDGLDELLGELIAGVTTLPPDAVWPVGKATPLSTPSPYADGCVFGIHSLCSDAGPVIRHDGTGEGRDCYVQHQEIEVLCRFSGPQARSYAQRLADGLAMPQNREPLQLHDMAFAGASPIRASPEPVDRQADQPAAYRYDITVSLRRKLTRTYAVLNLRSASAAMTTDSSTPVSDISSVHS